MKSSIIKIIRVFRCVSRRSSKFTATIAVALLVSAGMLEAVIAAPGDLDPTFNGGTVSEDIAGLIDEARAVAIQCDGKIVVAGPTDNTNNSDFAVARFLNNGTLDPDFGGGGVVITDLRNSRDVANAVKIQSDGKIVVAGFSSIAATNEDFALVRYNPDGSLDTNFGTGGKVFTTFFSNFDEEINDITIQNDGKIVAVGFAPNIPGCTLPDIIRLAFAVARYNPDGNLDTSFDGDGKLTTSVGDICERNRDVANAVALQTDGKIVVAGTVFAGGFNFGVVRYNTNGSLDSSFDGDGKVVTGFPNSVVNQANDVAIQCDGKIVLAGQSTATTGNRNFALARYNSNGSLDTAFDGDGLVITDFSAPNPPFVFSQERANALAIQLDGKIVAAGDISTLAGGITSTPSDFLLVRYNSNGSLDTSFGMAGKVTTDFGGADDIAFDVAIQSDEKIVAAGVADSNFALARYDAGRSGRTVSIRVSPDNFTFPDVDFPQPATFTISSTGSEPVRITMIVSSNPARVRILDAPIGQLVPGDKTFRVSVVNPRIGRTVETITVCGESCSGVPTPPFTVTINGPVISPTTVPTLSEWGVIIMSLLLMTAGTVFVLRRTQLMATPSTVGGSASFAEVSRQPLFVPRLFGKVLAGTLALALLCLALLNWLAGQVSRLDLCATLLCTLLLAYLAHLLIKAAKDYNENHQ